MIRHRERYEKEFGLSPIDASTIIEEDGAAEYFEQAPSLLLSSLSLSPLIFPLYHLFIFSICSFVSWRKGATRRRRRTG